MLEKVKIREASPSHPSKGWAGVLRAWSIGLVTGWVSRDVCVSGVLGYDSTYLSGSYGKENQECKASLGYPGDLRVMDRPSVRRKFKSDGLADKGTYPPGLMSSIRGTHTVIRRNQILKVIL